MRIAEVATLATPVSRFGSGSIEAIVWHLAKGLVFFTSHFFEPDGRPKYFHDRTYPVDIQCAAQAIDTLAGLSDDDPDCLDRAVKIAEWTIANLQAADGHFCYRDLGWTRLPALGASDALRVSLKLPTIYARLMKNSLLSHEGKMNGKGKMPQLA